MQTLKLKSNKKNVENIYYKILNIKKKNIKIPIFYKKNYKLL